MTKEEANAYIQRVARDMAEHFDAVQIIVSWDSPETGDWHMEYNGSGNWYARRGMMQEVLQRDEGANHAHCFKQSNEEPPETSF